MDNELYHHGVKGMKWGQRRYQNKDGSLTSQGKKRAQENLSKDHVRAQELRKKRPSEMSNKELNELNKRNELEKKFNENNKQRSELDVSKDVLKSYSNMINQAKNINRSIPTKDTRKPLDLSNMSDKELRDRINRANLERQYNDLYNPPRVSKGRKYLTTVLEVGGSVTMMGLSAVELAIALKKVM